MLTSKKTLLLGTLAVSSFPVVADTVPNAGQLLQQQSILQYQPQAAIQLDEPEHLPTLTSDSNQQIKIEKIVIEGNQSLSTEALYAAVRDHEHQLHTLSDLQQLANQLTQYYQQHGYPYSRAYLPVQDLKDGHLRIAILEARYDRIIVDNQANIASGLINAIVAPLQSGEIIDAKTLQQQLKLLNRLDGIQVRNVISAGRYAGTSDLTINILPEKPWSGYIGMDNFGNEYTHEARFNAGIAASNILGLGDRLSLDAMSSGNLNYARVGYEATVNGAGTRLGGSYSELEYELGKEYKALDAEGTAQQASLWLSQPVLLNNQSEVVLGAHYDFKRLEDDIAQADVYRHRDLHVVGLSLDASQTDMFWGGGVSQLGVRTEIGRVNFKNTAAAQEDLATAHTQDDFIIASLQASRLQNVGAHNTQLYVSLEAQFSPDNLDSAQQFSVGGSANLAGYDNSVLSGSSGYYALAELRQGIYASAQNQVTAKVFIDTATVKHQARKWQGLTGDNQESVHSAGLGLNWSNAKKWQAAVTVGFPIGEQPNSLDQSRDAEVWLNISKHF